MENFILFIGLFVFSNINYCFSVDNIENYRNQNNTINSTQLLVKPICLIEGDIVCPHYRYEENSTYYMASIDKNKLWLNRLIPVLIAQTYSESNVNLIKDAISDLEAEVCVKFNILTEQPTDGDFVWIQPLNGCYSSVGRVTGAQDLSLTVDCLNKGKGTVIHELIHALGIYHEHTRPDRDKYIFIDVGNIVPEFISNFKARPKDLVDLLDEPYDYYSIMHYGIYDFSIDPNSRPTITIIDQTVDVTKVGQRTHVSDLDKTKLNKLYLCHIQQCPQPATPAGGSINGHDFSVGVIVTFECNTDLTLVGSKQRFCRYDGQWSGRNVQCLEKSLHYCNFEVLDPYMCDWKPTTDIDFEWQRRSGATPQTDTGPIDDYTYETSIGHYIFMETSAPQRRGDKAKIISPQLSSSTGVSCISFAFYMFGQQLGSLSLYLTESSAGTQLIWEESGNQGPKWTEVKLLVMPKPNEAFQLIFEGIVGKKGSSDIALDEILVIECTEEEAVKRDFKIIKF